MMRWWKLVVCCVEVNECVGCVVCGMLIEWLCL